MITIQSSGRLANKLNYFVTGMFIHEMTGLHFIPEKIDGFVNTYTSLPGIYIQEQIRMSSISDSIDKVENFFQNLNQILYTGSNGKIERGFIVDNMINQYSLFKKMDAKRYLLIDDGRFKKPESDELVIHIRIGDYKYNNSVIENRYYLNAIELEKNNINKVTILTDSPNDSQLDEFRSIGCEIRCNSEIEDFAYIKNANKICISNSTFSWTAAYISDASIIYWPISSNKWPYSPNPNRGDADMRPIDKKNWIYI
jgi:hypothetical protein